MPSKLYLELNNITVESFNPGEISIVEKSCGAAVETLSVKDAYRLMVTLETFILVNQERRSAYYEEN